MIQARHTAGEWGLPHFADTLVDCDCRSVLSKEFMGCVATIAVDNGKLVSNGGNDCPPLEEAKANAHLITAAPDLLAELLVVRDVLRDFVDAEPVERRYVIARLAAIETVTAKAKGERNEQHK